MNFEAVCAAYIIKLARVFGIIAKISIICCGNISAKVKNIIIEPRSIVARGITIILTNTPIREIFPNRAEHSGAVAMVDPKEIVSDVFMYLNLSDFLYFSLIFNAQHKPKVDTKDN